MRASRAALLARPGYPALLAAVRARLEAGGAPQEMTLQGLDPDARQALADLLSQTKLPGPTARIRIDELDAALRTSRVGAGLVDVLETVGGPLADRRGARAAAQGEWMALWGRLADHPLTDREDVRAWLIALREHGLLTRLAGSACPGEAATLADAALEVIRRLPASGVPLAVLASEACHDPHALDPGRPTATLVLRWAAAFTGRDGVPVFARDRASCGATWGSPATRSQPASSCSGCAPGAAGCSRPRSPLTPTPVSRCASRCASCWATRWRRFTVRCTSARTPRWSPRPPTGSVRRAARSCAWRVCRTPRGTGCSACSQPARHWPFTVTLIGAASASVTCSPHGSAPPPGTTEARTMRPHLAIGRAGAPLAPATLEAVWDPNLGSALRAAGRRVDEEAVLDRLLDDLATADRHKELG